MNNNVNFLHKFAVRNGYKLFKMLNGGERSFPSFGYWIALPLVGFHRLIVYEQRLFPWFPNLHMALGQNLVTLVNTKIAGKWVFTPLTLIIIIGFDTQPYLFVDVVYCCIPLWPDSRDVEFFCFEQYAMGSRLDLQ